MGLAEVVLASINALKRKWRHSSVPKDGTEGNDGGAEGKSSSLFSPCCPKLVRLLFTRCPNMADVNVIEFLTRFCQDQQRDGFMWGQKQREVIVWRYGINV